MTARKASRPPKPDDRGMLDFGVLKRRKGFTATIWLPDGTLATGPYRESREKAIGAAMRTAAEWLDPR